MKKKVTYHFEHTDHGVETDKDVQRAVKAFDKVEPAKDIALVIEAGYKGPNDAYCKISGIKKPVVTKNKKVGLAVGDAVDQVSKFIRNDKEKRVDKKEHANKKLKAKEDEIEDAFEI